MTLEVHAFGEALANLAKHFPSHLSTDLHNSCHNSPPSQLVNPLKPKGELHLDNIKSCIKLGLTVVSNNGVALGRIKPN